jgi:hypothetical protein
MGWLFLGVCGIHPKRELSIRYDNSCLVGKGTMNRKVHALCKPSYIFPMRDSADIQEEKAIVIQ